MAQEYFIINLTQQDIDGPYKSLFNYDGSLLTYRAIDKAIARQIEIYRDGKFTVYGLSKRAEKRIDKYGFVPGKYGIRKIAMVNEIS